MDEVDVAARFCPDTEDEYDPTVAWYKLFVGRKALKSTVVAPLDPLTPAPPNHTRFVCISDTHGKHAKIENLPLGDALIVAGDFTNKGEPRQVAAFADWIRGLPHTHKIVIAGNHDTTFHEDYHRFSSGRWFPGQEVDAAATRALLLPHCTYLEDGETSVNGIRVWGSPWQPQFCDWAFNLPRGAPCAEKWGLVPDGVDVLITHGPALGHGDLCEGENRAGCRDLLDAIRERIRPAYHVCGHVHEGYGITTDGTTTFVNASTCDFNYRPVNPPIVFDLPNRS